MCAWQGGTCVAGGVWQKCVCVAGETATAAGGTHPTGMYFCFYNIHHKSLMKTLTHGNKTYFILLHHGQTFSKSHYCTNKNAFQWDAYRPLVDLIPACTVAGGGWEGVYLPRGVYLPGGCTCPGWVYLPGGCTCLGV